MTRRVGFPLMAGVLSTWATGAAAQPTQPCDLSVSSQYGCWETPPVCSGDSISCWNAFPNLQAVHMILTRTGKVLMFRQTCETSQSLTCRGASLWNPETYAGVRYTTATDDLFCAGQVVLADGKVLVVGGDSLPSGCANPNSPRGRKAVWVFDPANPGWQRKTSMEFERWYPTLTLLPSGKVLVTSGVSCGVLADKPELYDPLTDTWTTLTSAANTRYGPEWYPWMHVLTDGKVLHAGPHRSTHAPPKMETLAPTSGSSWLDFGTSIVAGGGSTMYVTGVPATGEKARILKTSHTHGDSINAKAEIVIEDGTRAPTDTLSYRRRRHNQVVLPDGTVLVLGGAKHKNEQLTDAVKQTERWDPGTGHWTTWAPAPRDRMYHSTGLLLPDGRILSAGGEYRPGPVHNRNGDFFSPPYLYKNNVRINDATERPIVTDATVPALVACGSTFKVKVTPPAGTSITKACFIRPGAVTHANNMDQRYLPLSSTVLTGDTLKVTAPTSAEEAPPGYYMLFFLNNDGGTLRPSKAKFVRVWGFLASSLLAQNVVALLDSFDVTISGNTNLAAAAGDSAVFYRPDGQTAGARKLSGWISGDGLQHSSTWRVRSSPCPAGNMWEFQMISNTSTPVSTSKSVRKKFEVLYCLES